MDEHTRETLEKFAARLKEYSEKAHDQSKEREDEVAMRNFLEGEASAFEQSSRWLRNILVTTKGV